MAEGNYLWRLLGGHNTRDLGYLQDTALSNIVRLNEMHCGRSHTYLCLCNGFTLCFWPSCHINHMNIAALVKMGQLSRRISLLGHPCYLLHRFKIFALVLPYSCIVAYIRLRY